MSVTHAARAAWGNAPDIRATPVILCVDDDPDVTSAIEMQLRHFEVVVVRAFHGMHGFSEALHVHPDVIVMDLAMPNGDGVSILECLRRNPQTSGAAVIILSGMRDPALMRKAFALGADQFLKKPLNADELIHEISRFVDLRTKAP